MGQKFYRSWLLVCTIGIPIAIAVGKAVCFEIGFGSGLDKGWFAGLIVGAIVTGTGVGGIQWLVLKQFIPTAKRWIAASAMGWAMGSAIALWVGNFAYGTVNLALFGTLNLVALWATSGAASGAVGGAVGGAVMGAAQCLVWERNIFKASWWVLTSSLSWAMGRAITGAFDLAAVGMVGLVSTWIVFGIIYGAITGKMLLLFQLRLSKDSVMNLLK